MIKVPQFQSGRSRGSVVDIGPLINEKSFKVKEYIEIGVKEGAKMLVGEIPQNCDDGYYIQPVIFTDVENNMRIAQEEIFGPVLVVVAYDTLEDAVAIANDSPYGLCGGVFGEEKEAIEMARQMETA
jgi:acyl-CoA reductase-like NAD-dependent aldehyde dehydrogenase